MPVHRHQRPAHAIRENDRLGRVHRPRDPDLDVKGPPQPGDLGSQRRHALVEGVDLVDAEGELEAAALVADGNGAEDPLVAAFEIEGDGLAHVEGAVGPDLEGHGEAVDGEARPLRRRGRSESRQQEEGSFHDWLVSDYRLVSSRTKLCVDRPQNRGVSG